MSADNVTSLLELLDRTDEPGSQFSFGDYVFMRRVNLGWNDCAGGVHMSRIMVPCGLKITVPGMIASP